MKIMTLLFAAATIPLAPQVQENNYEETDIQISGRWLPALDRALSEFKKIEKASLDCYRITAHVEK